MKKKVLSLVALASLMILGGCGRSTSDVSDPFHPNTDDTGDTSKPSDTPSTPDTEKPTEKPTEPTPTEPKPTEPVTEEPTVEELKITNSETTLAPGATLQLTANKEGVVWSSSNDALASVSETGLVTMLKDSDDVTITATLGEEVATITLASEPVNLKTIDELNKDTSVANFGYTPLTSIRGTLLQKDGDRIIIGDGTSAIASYKINAALFANYEIGANLLVTAKFQHYWSTYQIDSKSDAKVYETTKFNTEINKTPTTLDLQGMQDLAKSTDFVCGNYYKVENTKFFKSGNYTNLNVAGTTVKATINSSKKDSYTLDTWGTLTFMAQSINTSSSVITFWVEEFVANPVVTTPTSLKLDVVEKTMKVNEEFQLTTDFGFDPFTNVGEFDKTVTWTSENQEVATVTDGLVKALTTGTTTITAKSTAFETLTASCTITVEEATVDPEPEPQPSTNFTKVTSIAAGDIITFAFENNAISTYNTSNYYDRLVITPAEDGTISPETQGLVSFEVEDKGEGKFAFKNRVSGNYLGFEGEKNKAYEYVEYDSTKCDVTVSFSEDTTAVITLVSNSVRLFQYNPRSGQERFAFYKSTSTGQNNINVYALPKATK